MLHKITITFVVLGLGLIAPSFVAAAPAAVEGEIGEPNPDPIGAAPGCCFIKQFKGKCQGITDDKDGECVGPYKKGVGSCGTFPSLQECADGIKRSCMTNGGCTKNTPWVYNGSECTCGIAWSYHSEGDCKEISIPGLSKVWRCVKKGTVTPIPIPKTPTGMSSEECAEYILDDGY